MQHRIANVVYLVSVVVACLAVPYIAFAIFSLGTNGQFQSVGPVVVVVVFLAVVVWGVGWSLRYILTGKKGLRPEL